MAKDMRTRPTSPNSLPAHIPAGRAFQQTKCGTAVVGFRRRPAALLLKHLAGWDVGKKFGDVACFRISFAINCNLFSTENATNPIVINLKSTFCYTFAYSGHSCDLHHRHYCCGGPRVHFHHPCKHRHGRHYLFVCLPWWQKSGATPLGHNSGHALRRLVNNGFFFRLFWH